MSGMTIETAVLRGIGAGPVDPLTRQTARRPLPFTGVRLSAGLLAHLQETNAIASIKDAHGHLEPAWENFRRAAAGDSDTPYFGPVFEDGEVYKWLEAVAWQAGRGDDPLLDDWLESFPRLIAAAQSDDGYLNTFFQVSGERSQRYELLGFDHEIFNMGAMIQSAVAHYRSTGRSEMLAVACRAADHLDNTFGPDKRTATCGHPVVEMALVELYRTTQEPRYLALARYFVEVRGHGVIVDHRGQFDSAYYSDRMPVRETRTPEGHAVRAMYLAAGATDVAIETGDTELLTALRRQWDAMLAEKTYVTGGLGARWEGEAFGDPYELPSDRSYAETCAAIAGMQWSWRLFLATGDAKYAEFIERQFYNAVLPGMSYSGDSYFYANTLQLRSNVTVDDTRHASHGRQHWFGCSCCPTNLMRTFASIHQYVASSSDHAVQLNQYAAGIIEVDSFRLDVTTDYPWDGRISVRVLAAPSTESALQLRIPSWSGNATVDGESVTAGEYHSINRVWHVGDEVLLDIPMTPRLTRGNARIDAVRGAVAIERGPLVYAIEQVDQAPGMVVDDIEMTAPELRTEMRRLAIIGEIPVVLFDGTSPAVEPVGYLPADTHSDGPRGSVTAIPYFLWANRGVGAMKVWIPHNMSESAPELRRAPD
jgi:uncharacterized protein